MADTLRVRPRFYYVLCYGFYGSIDNIWIPLLFIRGPPNGMVGFVSGSFFVWCCSYLTRQGAWLRLLRVRRLYGHEQDLLR